MTGNTVSPQFTICALLEVFRKMKIPTRPNSLKLVDFYEYNLPSAGRGMNLRQL